MQTNDFFRGARHTHWALYRSRKQTVALALDRDVPGNRPLHAGREGFGERSQIALRLAVPRRAQIEIAGPRGQPILSESMSR
jgi:hypothetical protein